MQGWKRKAWVVAVGSLCGLLAWSPVGAGTKAGKTRTATGALVSGGQGVWQLQPAGQKPTLRFRVTEQTKIWRETSVKTEALKAGMVVRLHGQGQDDRLAAARVECFGPDEVQWQEAKKPKPGAAYSAKARATTLIARIQGLNPLTVHNRRGQVIRVESTPQTRIVLHAPEAEGNLAVGGKAQVTYTQQNGEMVAREIVLKQEG